MAHFTLVKQPPRMWELEIEGKVYEIPLSSALTLDEAAPLDTVQGTRAFFNKYLPPEVQKTLTLGDYNQISLAWVAASNASTGIKLGE